MQNNLRRCPMNRQYKYHFNEFYDEKYKNEPIPEDANSQFIGDIFRKFKNSDIVAVDENYRKKKLYGEFTYFIKDRPISQVFYKRGVARKMFIFDIRKNKSGEEIVAKYEIHNKSVDFKKQSA